MSGALIMAALVTASTGAVPHPIRIWGPPAMAGIARRWADVYSLTHPQVTFELVMKGSDVAVPGLYSGRADIALMGREDEEVDDNGFSRPVGYRLTRIAITSGSLATPGKSDAIAVLVPTSNPLVGLTLADLGRILDCGAGADHKPLRTWGGLGLKGWWAGKPIHVYAYDMGSRTGRFVQHVAARDARRMCWSTIREYGDTRRLDGTIENSADQIGAAARRDPYALAIANAAQTANGLRLVGISKAVGGSLVTPTPSSIINGSYPFARRTYAFIKHKPGSPIDPQILCFLRFVLSPAGQGSLAADRGYLPLDPSDAAVSSAALDAQ